MTDGKAKAATQTNTDVGATAPAAAEQTATSTTPETTPAATAQQGAAPSDASQSEQTPAQGAEASQGSTFLSEGAETEAGDTAEKGDGETAAEGGDEKQETGAPENYTEFTFPEGVQPDTALVEAFTPVAKELGLSQENAQKLVDMYAQRQIADAQAFMQSFQDTREGWRNEMKQWPNSAEVRADALRVLKSNLATPEFRQLVTGNKDSWLGDHPAVVRFLANIAPLIKEDSMLDGKTSPHPPDILDRRYPNHNKRRSG